MNFPAPLTRARRVVSLATLLLVAGHVPRAQAQPDHLQLSTGARVRIVRAAGEEPFVGNVARVTPDTLAVGVGGGSVLLQLPLAQLVSLEASVGRDRLLWTGNGVVYGSVGTALATGFVLAQQYPGSLVGFVGAIAGGLVGAVGGGMVGAMLSPERWEAVRLPVRAP